MAQRELQHEGMSIDDFSEFRFLDSHDSVVLAVGNGSIDAGTVRTDTLERMHNEGIIDIDNFQLLVEKQHPGFPYRVSTELYPEWPFAKLASTPDGLANRVLIALLQMPAHSPAAIKSQVDGWTTPLDYSSVHHLLEEMHLGPYVERGQVSFTRMYHKYKWWLYAILAGFIVGMTLLIYISRLNRQLKQSKMQIEGLNSGLENKVRERTSELQKMYSHEKHLKDILKTIAEVNERLITSVSTQTIIQNSMDTLARSEHYRFVWMGILEENLLKVVSQSKENREILQHQQYSFDNHQSNFGLMSAQAAIQQNTTLIEKLPGHYLFEIGNDRYDCSSCWLITLPLHSNEQDAPPLGNLSVFSERVEGFEPEEVRMLENLATDIGLTLNTIKQRSALKAMELEKISNYEETILAFVNIIEQRDNYTAGHTVRVAQYSRLIAQQMGLDEQKIIKLEKAAILHDIGKVVTPDAILLKPGNLTLLEYELIKQHSDAGYRMLSKIDMYQDLAQIILYHHVRYDGKGYPKTPRNDPQGTVSMLSFIMAVADAFDAMTTNRIYKSRKTINEATRELALLSGSQFHPEVAAAALIALNDVKIIDTSQMPESKLEQHRFAYFFKDLLTDLYNENYLNATLSQQPDEQRCLHFIELTSFKPKQVEKVWEERNLFLKRFAEQLLQEYGSALIFRYHGKNFILIFEQHREISTPEILRLEVFENSDADIKLSHFELKDGIPSF